MARFALRSAIISLAVLAAVVQSMLLRPGDDDDTPRSPGALRRAAPVLALLARLVAIAVVTFIVTVRGSDGVPREPELDWRERGQRGQSTVGLAGAGAIAWHESEYELQL